MLAHCALALIAALPLGPSQGQVEREQHIRVLAHAGDERTEELIELLRAADWRERYTAVEALRRAGDQRTWPFEGALAHELQRLLQSERHPNVQSVLLELAARAGADGGLTTLDAARLQSLSGSPHPDVRIALCVYAARCLADRGWSVTGRLAWDPDPRVMRQASRLFLRSGAEAQEQLVAWFAMLRSTSQPAPGLGHVDWLDALQALPAGEHSLETLTRVRESLGQPVSALERFYCSTVEARLLVLGGQGSIPLLLHGWFARPQPRGELDHQLDSARRRLLLEGARAAVPQISQEVFEGLCAADGLGATRAAAGAGPLPFIQEGSRADIEQRGLDREALIEEWVTLAAETSTPAALCRGALSVSLTDSTSELLWSDFKAAPVGIDPAQLLQWIDQERAVDLRRAVVRRIGADWRTASDPAWAPLLLRALTAQESEVWREAQRTLVRGPDPERFGAELLQAFMRLERAEIERFLRELPEDWVPRPYRNALLEVHADPERRSPRVIALLGRFVGDAVVIQRLERGLGEDLRRLADSAFAPVVADLELPAFSAEACAVETVRALWRMQGEASATLLLEVLPEAASLSDEVGKTIVASLAKSDAGRSRLASFLDAKTPSRTRTEVALVLSRRGDEQALSVLVEKYESLDWRLRHRALRSMGQSGLAAGREFLQAILNDPERSLEERIECTGALGPWGREPALVARWGQLLEDSTELELRRTLIRALGSAAEPAATALLRDFIAEHALAPGPAPLGESARVRELLRAEALEALALTGALPELLHREWSRRPAQRWPFEAERRLSGERVAAPEFAYRSELSVLGELVAQGAEPDALLGESGWVHWDARLLFAAAEEVGSRAASQPEQSKLRALTEQLNRAGLVALDGEPPGKDDSELRCAARVAAISWAGTREDYRAYAQLCSELLCDLDTGRIAMGAAESILGRPDAAAGTDPRARLESAVWQARAHGAWAEGEQSRARALAARAAVLTAGSDAAREAQERLESLLSEAD